MAALRDRLSPKAVAQLDQAQAQHTHIDAPCAAVARHAIAGSSRRTPPARDVLVAALHLLHRLLAEHLDDEERTLLPLAAAHLTRPRGTPSSRPAPPVSSSAGCRS